METQKIGIDIGRVIIGAVQGGRADTSFLGSSDRKAMATPPSPHAFECIARLVEAFDGEAWLVSKCGSNVQRKTRLWLEAWDFYHQTGLEPGRVRFCKERPQKALICRELGITHFVDDRVDIMQHLERCVPHRFLFGEQPRRVRIPHGVTPVVDWPTAEREVLKTLADAGAPTE